MALMKFELELPEFERELEINITIRRDGEVLYRTSSPTTITSQVIESESKPIWKQEPEPEKKPAKKSTAKKQDSAVKVSSGGNLMNIDGLF